jgi:hypothetical protein
MLIDEEKECDICDGVYPVSKHNFDDCYSLYLDWDSSQIKKQTQNIIIYQCIKKYLFTLKSIPCVKYNKKILSYESINAFVVSLKKDNDSNNKIRENVIGAIINNKIPSIYFTYRRWLRLKTIVMDYIYNISNNEHIVSLHLTHRGGRTYKYDFDIEINDKNYLIELKFNTSTIANAPQFVSPMKPSTYLSNSYEEYFYDNYLYKLSTILSLPPPTKVEYISEIHSPKPLCMIAYQEKYYNGCAHSSKFTNDKKDIDFYNYAKKLDNESRNHFIKNTDLNIAKLSEYLKETQRGKIYMMYKDSKFHTEYSDMNDYIIDSYTKDPDKYMYIMTSNTGKKIKVLLRWKNGNGIAFPAFQIS